MRFLPSVPWRTVARVGLTMAVLGVVAYDLCGRVVKPEGATSSGAVVSLEAKGKTAAVGTSFVVCGDVAAPTNPFTLSSASTYQSLLIYLSGCKIAPIIGDGVGGLASIVVGSDGWLSFQSVQIASPIPAGAIAGALSMATGSNLEVVISTALVPYPRTTVSYPLLTASSGACPTLSTLNQVITNCPADPTIPAYLGSYQCSVAVVPTGILGCNISLSIAGPLVWPSSLYTIQFCKQCALTFTPAMFLAAIYYTTGIGAAAIDVISWSGPLPYVVGFKVYASSTLIANAAAGVIIASAKAGTLNNYLGVMYAGLGYLPPEQFTKTCLCDKFYPVLGPGNGSNPDLLILLVLLAIPVLAVIAAFVYLYCISLPKPAPEPMCPAAPLMAAAMPMAMASTAYSPMGVMPTTM